MIVAVTEPNQVGDARHRAVDFARTLALEPRAGAVALVATEMASNLVKHCGGGELLLQSFDDVDGCGMELVALDLGRGMENFARSRADGHSTSGTQGTGLGAIARQSDQFCVYSRPGLGTALHVRFVAAPPSMRPGTAPGFQIGVAVAPYPGEIQNGDAWRFLHASVGPSLLVVDGSGHGAEAARAADAAVAVFESHGHEDCVRIVDRIHRALSATRGAAVALCRIDRTAQKIVFTGIGNVAGAIVGSEGMRRMVSLAGTAGHNARKIQAFDYPFTQGLVVMHSDGLGSAWNLDRYPGLARAHPTLVAAVLFRDFWRRRDDVTILVSRQDAAP